MHFWNSKIKFEAESLALVVCFGTFSNESYNLRNPNFYNMADNMLDFFRFIYHFLDRNPYMMP